MKILKFITILFFLVVSSIWAQKPSIDSPLSQYEYGRGHNPCTSIALEGADRFLAGRTIGSRADLEEVLDSGTTKHQRAGTDELRSCEAIIATRPHLLLHSVESLQKKPSLNVYQDMLESMKSFPGPICSLITTNRETVALCKSGDKPPMWTFLDSHRNSRFERGSHVFVTPHDEELLRHFQKHPSLMYRKPGVAASSFDQFLAEITLSTDSYNLMTQEEKDALQSLFLNSQKEDLELNQVDFSYVVRLPESPAIPPEEVSNENPPLPDEKPTQESAPQPQETSLISRPSFYIPAATAAAGLLYLSIRMMRKNDYTVLFFS